MKLNFFCFKEMKNLMPPPMLLPGYNYNSFYYQQNNINNNNLYQNVHQYEHDSNQQQQQHQQRQLPIRRASIATVNDINSIYLNNNQQFYNNIHVSYLILFY
jgi:hypothetical protein